MEEKIVWKGCSSHVVNLGIYLLCGLVTFPVLALVIWNGRSMNSGLLGLLLFAAAVPVVFAFWKWLENRCRVYEVTTERIRVTCGVFNRRTDELELYRVKDSSLVQPLLYRIFGAGNIVTSTNDTSTPTFTIEAIKASDALREELRKNIEACRDRKRVRVAELEGPPPA